MNIQLNNIYNLNCLDGIAAIPDHSIAAIITDPPYCAAMQHNGVHAVLTDMVTTKPFYTELFRHFARVLSPTGSLYFFTDWRASAFYLPLIDDILPVDNTLVWDKGCGAGNFYTNEYESILFHTNNRRFRCKGARNILRGIPAFNSGAKKTNGEKQHPTQKPIELIERLITDSTSPGDVVLDCFLGSGTTAVAAIRTGRQYIGFEILEKYYNIAVSRIAEETQKKGI